LIAAGESGSWNQDLHSFGTAPYPINDQDPSQHVVSFILYFIPEPSTFALAGLGALALVVCRYKRLHASGPWPNARALTLITALCSFAPVGIGYEFCAQPTCAGA